MIQKQRSKNIKKSKVLKLIVSVAAGLLLAAFAVIYIFYVAPGAFSAHDAVTGYLEASMRYDYTEMVRLSSDYNKTILFGSDGYTNSSLRKALKTAYSDKTSVYSESDIVFTLKNESNIEKNSAEFTEISDECKRLIGTGTIEEVKRLNVVSYVDGTKNIEHSAYAVKKGLRWYYLYS